MISPKYRKPGKKLPLTFKPIKKLNNIFLLLIRQQKSFMGLTMEAQKDMLLFLVEDFIANNIMEAIYTAGHLSEHGNGIALTLSFVRYRFGESNVNCGKRRKRSLFLTSSLRRMV